MLAKNHPMSVFNERGTELEKLGIAIAANMLWEGCHNCFAGSDCQNFFLPAQFTIHLIILGS